MKKRIKLLLMVLCLVLLCNTSVSAQALLQEDFEGYAVGRFNPPTTGDGHWNGHGITNDDGSRYAIAEENGNRYLSMHLQTSISRYCEVYWYDSYSGTMLISMRIKFSGNQEAIELRGVREGVTLFIPLATFGNNQVTCAGSTFTGIAKEQWHDFKMVLDIPNQTYSVTIDNELKATCLPLQANVAVDSLDFLNASTSYLRIAIPRDTNGARLAIDDILIGKDLMIEQKITALDSAGQPIGTLPVGSVWFTTRISNLQANPTPVALLAVIYKGDEIVDFSLSESEIPVGNTVQLQTEAEVQEAGCEAVVMLWDGIFSMNALTEAYILN